jgi:hypothetical protein
MRYLDFWRRLLPDDSWVDEWERNGGTDYPIMDLGPQPEETKPRMDRIHEEERLQTMEKNVEMEQKGVLEEEPWDAPTRV